MRPRTATSKPTAAPALLKIGALARLAGVPSATVKHYVREGLIEPARTGRNIAYFDQQAPERIRRIKELQQRGFLPLRLIKELMSDKAPALADTVETIRGTLDAIDGPGHTRSRADLVAAGVTPQALAFLESAGLIVAVPVGNGDGFAGDDLALLRTLGAARKAGITAEMLPLSIVSDYLEAIRALVKVELSLFRDGVLPVAGRDLAKVTEAATKLSERLVVLLRRRLIVPSLQAMASATPAAPRKPRVRSARQPRPARRR